MSKIVDFVCVRVKNEVGKFMKSNIISRDLINGEFSVTDIQHCIETCDRLSQDEKIAAQQMIDKYNQLVEKNYNAVKNHFRHEYANLIENLKTCSDDFRFTVIMQKYRNNINPVSALYYEVRHMLHNFSPENEAHAWLMDIITDAEFIKKLLNAIDEDVRSLEKIMNIYYQPLTNNKDNIPLEIFHIRHLLEDFKVYRSAFQVANIWNDE